MRDYHKATERGEWVKGENTCYFWFLYHGNHGAKVRSIIAELRSAENGLNAKISVICDFVLCAYGYNLLLMIDYRKAYMWSNLPMSCRHIL